MLNSNFKLMIITILSVLITVGCWTPDRSGSSGDGNNGTNFRMQGGKFVTANKLDSSNNKNLFIGKEKKHDLWQENFLTQFTFEVCLTQKGSEKNVYKKTFKVMDSSDNQISKATTRSNGCLVWNEPVYYNFLAPSKYLKMKRKIVGLNLYKGSLSFDIILNPWAQQRGKKNSAFIPRFEGNLLENTDYEVIEDPEIIEAALAGKYDLQDLDGQLFLENFNYSLNKIEGSKISSEYNLRIEGGQVFAKARDADGVYHKIDLVSGAYSLATKVLQASRTTNNELSSISLYHPNFSGQDGVSNKKSITIVNPIFYTRNSNVTEKSIFHNYSDTSVLRGNIPLAIKNWDRQDQARILLELVGVEFPFSNFLKPLKAVYRGEGFEKGKANLMSAKEHNLFKTSGHGSRAQSKFDSLMSPENNLANPENLPVFHEYTISPVDSRFLSQANGEAVSIRGIEYKSTVCLTQRHGQVRPQGQKFLIRIFNETKGVDVNLMSRQKSNNVDKDKPYKTEVMRTTTEDGGCLSWVDEIWFKHYKPESYFRYRAEIQEVGSDQINEVSYIINPWDEGWTFGQDLRDTTAPFLKETRDQKKISSRIFLPNFSYETLRFKYDIDKYLNLNVKKQVLFNFSASTLRYNSNKSGRFGVYHQRNGVYLLKAAMEKNYLDPSSKGIWEREAPTDCDSTKSSCHATTKFVSCPDGDNSCEPQNRSYLEGPIVDPNRPSLAMKRHLSVVSRLVRVDGGKIITPVEFEVKDLRVMRLRSNLFVQIDPINEWMLWMAKLYDQLYADAFKKRYGDVALSGEFQLERKRNIYKIIERMKNDPMAIHNAPFVYDVLQARSDRVIKNALNNDVEPELEMATHIDGKEYEVCHSPQNVPVTWDDIFSFFNISNPVLTARTGISDLGSFHKEEYYKKNKGDVFEQADGKCLYVYNVIRDLLENNHSKMPLNPIDFVELANFIDKDSGLEQTTFFGPMTYLNMGNSSNMRPTKNISEFVCPSGVGDCDEHKSQHLLGRDLEKAMARYELNQPKDAKAYIEDIANEEGSDAFKVSEHVKYKLSDEFLERSEKKVNSYEISRFFGSLKYANNLLIYRYQEPKSDFEYAEGDLEEEMYRLKDLDKKESELRSKLFYYLNNFNLDFVSLGNEEVRYFDPGAQQANGDSCEKLSTIPFDNLEDESTCFQATDAYTNEEAISELTSDEDTVSDVRQMIQTLKITPELADKICYHQLNRFYQVKFNAKKENRKKHKPGKVPMYTSNKVPEVIYTRDMGKIPSEEIKFHEECVAELVAQVNFDPIKKFDIINGSILDVERKIRVKDTGRYAFKGGKALNVNVGNQLSLNHNTSYGFSESRAFKFNNISDTLLGWIPAFGKGIGRWAKNLFDTAGDMIMGDQKWAESDTNSVGEGTAISEGTFLVMQNATLDVELEDYYQCVAITFSETFLNRIDIKGESYKEQGLVEPFIQTLADVNGIEGTDEELIGASNSFKSAATRGLLICDDSEQNRNKENYRTLPIRENFYYFTQHFTEGDMLDSGDLANHPWLKNIRGKTDMWRFLSKIRNQDMSIKGKNKTLPYAKYLEQMGLDRKYIEGKDRKVGFRKQRGSLNLGDEWPIYQLIKAYHGTVPTFPGVYSSLHSPCNYGLDFPWGDQAKDSFEAKDTAMFDNFENRAKSKIQRSIKKFHEANFITDDPDVQASIEAGVYDSDEDIENHTMRTVRENNPDAAALYPDLFEPASKSEPKEGDREQKHIFPYEKNGNGTLKGINMVIMKKERDQNSDNPSQERIDACLGYMN